MRIQRLAGFVAGILLAVPWFLMGGARAKLERSSRDVAQDTNRATKYGISQRTEWASSHIHGTPEPPPPYRTERVFPKLSFKNPTVIASAPGTDRLFVAEQASKLYSIPNDPNCEHADLFLDLPREIKTLDPGESIGDCYGLAFHPDFENNRYCYVCYIVNGAGTEPLADGTRVSRFRVTRTDPPRCDPASEEIVITWLAGGHNGGCLAFGPDGYLYISTGDATSPNPPDGLDAGQDMSRLLSGILRIDVDHRDGDRTYSVPPDNPFVSLEGARPEKWAYGFRNPWKFSFDRATGELWLGDVGWELWEMVHRVERGGNYGWSVMEGPQPVKPGNPRGPTPIQLPAISLPHSEAASVTGGYVYRGSKLKELVGAYIFGDWETRRLWAARWDGAKIVSRQDLVEPTLRIVAFGEDRAGELYLVDYDDGTIHQIVPNDTAHRSQGFPKRLSDTGLFQSVAEHRMAQGVLPFSINAEQWSDSTTAERSIGLPGNSAVTMHKSAVPVPGTIMQTRLVWPPDAVLAKTVSLELERGRANSRRRVETQVLHYDGKIWRAYSYRWNPEQTDAELVGADGAEQAFDIRDPEAPGGHRRLNYSFAPRASCMRCHNPWAQHTLAFNLAQIDRTHQYDGVKADQVTTLEHIGILALAATDGTAERDNHVEPVQTAGKLVDPSNPELDINLRARSYLHVNCSHCHQLGAGGTAEIDLRFDLPLDRTKAVGVRPMQGTFGIHDAQIVAPGDPFRSVLLYRISKLGRGRMPHIGSDWTDPRGIELIHDWIERLASTNVASRDGTVSSANGVRSDAAISRLISSTRGALELAYAVQRGGLSSELREHAIAMATASPDSQIRDLFEPFVPDEQRTQRLGAVIRPEQLLAVAGDSTRGRELFFNVSGVACKSCHRISGVGSTLGPDLSNIAGKYAKAQILESILEPSKSIDPKYVTYLVETTQGTVLTGLLVERTADAVVLRDAQDKLVRIPAGQVQQCTPQRQSIMPELLLRDMTEQQVADLLEFLAGLK